MIRLDDLALFVRSAALGSFSQAAREVNLLPGQASAAIQRLERELDIRLFARSTRSLRLTEEGKRYLPYAQDALLALREGREGMRGEDAALSGTLQIAAPSDFGRNLLLPWISAFRSHHPGLDIQLLVSDQVADIFRDPVDIALRYGQIDDASFIALPVAPENRRVLVASPAYLARHGRPRSPLDLATHSCLVYRLRGRSYDRWCFPATDEVVQVSGPLVSDDADVVRRWAVAGEGITYKSWLDVHQDVLEGRLEVLLPKMPGEPTPMNLVCPHRKQFSPAVKLLHALVAERCRPITAQLLRMLGQ
ncbi:LysR family transcriptional regulator [Massilia sp. ZL223]|uniref:LysR family transcriptional regulator n=1 Tax=Massilia sp. ZL223 TaxID=2824904 RepID=UPI001B82BC90|nr:LysR family transcriptional regulator [Massilia sp. ZL223]MBQ5962235.1 LysR family transcriptional regulator [Massilia sp. ZL223]